MPLVNASGTLAKPSKVQAAREERCAQRVAAKFMDYVTFASAGGSDWYTRARADILAEFGLAADLFADLLAATSPQTDVRRNVKLAKDALSRHVKGEPQAPWIPSHADNIARALAGEPLRGPKVQAFARALRGDVHAIVVDTWMLRAAGLGAPRRLKRPGSFRIVQRAIALTAEWSGQPATECQAQIWFAYRAANWTAQHGPGTGYLPIREAA